MACTSPNQWAMTSPRTSSSSRLHLASGDLQDEASDVDTHEEQGGGSDELLDHVRQLIVDLLVDDAGQCSSRLSEATGHDAVGQPGGNRDAKHHSNNPEAEEDSARERLLEDKLARVLLELAVEQDNLRLAANAGNALLEELSSAREDIDVLQDELEAAQLERDRSTREAQRLGDQNAALETELQRYDVPYGAWDSTGQQNALSHHQQLQQQRRPSLTSRSGSFSRTDSCERCSSREVELTQLNHRADELRRRCMELELARERDQQRERELAEEITQLQQCSHEQQLETARIQHDLEFVTTQLEQRGEEIERVQAARGTLRQTARRLEAENEDLRARLTVRDELVVKLESSKARAATQLQVAENRTKSAQAETRRATETLQQLQKQLENALAQTQQQSGRSTSTKGGDDEAEVQPHEKEVRDMELLLQDATREVTALRLENRILRRQSSTKAASEASQVRGRRRKTLCTDSPAMTAADVLELGNRELKKGAAAVNHSGSGSHKKLPPTSLSQLAPLEIETIKQHTDAQHAKATDVTPEDGKKRRKMALELKWVDEAATTVGVSAEEDDSSSIIPLEEKPRALLLPSESELCPGAVEDKGVGDEEQVDVGYLTTSPVAMKRPTAFARLNHVNDHCVISGATEVNSPDVRLYGIEGKRARRSTVGGIKDSRARELSIEVLKREAAESPPKSPLYLGLSFIACATAATAAGLLVRR